MPVSYNCCANKKTDELLMKIAEYLKKRNFIVEATRYRVTKYALDTLIEAIKAQLYKEETQSTQQNQGVNNHTNGGMQ